MRKVVTGTATALQPVGEHEWLDLEQIASVEVSSESSEHPVESALSLMNATGQGWRASVPGEQKVTILFDNPTLIHLIHLQFEEGALERTQEFTLTWTGADQISHPVERQQWNFSPTGSTAEVENFRVNLAGVMRLELVVRPDISGGPAVATLTRLRLA